MNKKVVWLPYDFDTAIGINNEGTLSYGYSLEDIDQVNGRDVYNGQDSVLWVNLRACFGSEIQSMYRSLRSSGAISYEKVKKLFEDHQAVWPEALRNEDSFFKYIQPLLEDGDDNYLSMLQGSKKEQRKWWLYNRIKYLDSKYNAGEAQTDRIQLRGYAKANITIRPYADIYATIKFGSYTVSQRATRNQDYTLVCPIDTLNDTEIYIYSSSQLSSVGDLSGLKTGFADFHLATKLTELILGSADPNYENGNLRRVTAGNLPLLKKLDVRNCTGLGLAHAEGESPQLSVDLSGCTNIEEVYFGGTGIRGVDLPNGGVLRILDLPGSITNLTIRNQTSLTTLTCPDYSNISTLWLEGMGDVMSLSTITNIVDSVTSGCRIRLFNFYWNFNSIADVHTFLNKFDGMIGVDQNGDNVEHPQIYAHVHVPSATGDQIDAINADWPDIVVDADVMTLNLRYWNFEGTQLIYTETIQKNHNGTYSGQPTHAVANGYDFTFAGWSLYKNSTTPDVNATKNLTGNRDVYAAYTLTEHLYTVKFVRATADGGGTLYIQSGLHYGDIPVYSGAEPTSTKTGEWRFNGWTPEIQSVTADTTYTAKFKDASSITRQLVRRTIQEVDTADLTEFGIYAFNSCAQLAYANMPLVLSIPYAAFSYCMYLRTVSMPLATIVGEYAFYNCHTLSSIYAPNVSNIQSNAFGNCYGLQELVMSNNIVIGVAAYTRCSSLTTVYLPKIERIENYTFMSCQKLTTVNLEKVSYIGRNAFEGCSRLMSIELPNIASIDSYAFYGCTSLSMIVMPNVSEVVPLGDTYAFSRCYSLSIYVPDMLVNSYKTASRWSVYSSRIYGMNALV